MYHGVNEIKWDAQRIEDCASSIVSGVLCIHCMEPDTTFLHCRQRLDELCHCILAMTVTLSIIWQHYTNYMLTFLLHVVGVNQCIVTILVQSDMPTADSELSPAEDTGLLVMFSQERLNSDKRLTSTG